MRPERGVKQLLRRPRRRSGDLAQRDETIAGRMRSDWDTRAAEAPHWYIASDAGSEAEFDESGRTDVAHGVRNIDPAWLAAGDALEIGCGIGRMSRHLAPKVRSLVGVDVSTEMVRQGNERLRGVPNVTLRAVSGTDLGDFSDGSFDFVFSYVVFQHIPKRVVRRYFAEAHRVLRPGGVFRGQLAYVDGQPEIADEDTFTMRSWTAAEAYAALGTWRCASIETLNVCPGTDHLWISAFR